MHCDVASYAGEFQTLFRAISPSEHQYLWKESEDLSTHGFDDGQQDTYDE